MNDELWSLYLYRNSYFMFTSYSRPFLRKLCISGYGCILKSYSVFIPLVKENHHIEIKKYDDVILKDMSERGR